MLVTKKHTADVLIPNKRAITLVFWYQHNLVGARIPFHLKFALKVTHPVENCRLYQYLLKALAKIVQISRIEVVTVIQRTVLYRWPQVSCTQVASAIRKPPTFYLSLLIPCGALATDHSSPSSSIVGLSFTASSCCNSNQLIPFFPPVFCSILKSPYSTLQRLFGNAFISSHFSACIQAK